MSNWFNIHCRDCKVSSNDYRGRIEQTRPIIAMASTLAILHERMNDLDCDLRVECFPINLWWFAAHHTHDLISIDSYGRCDDECGERFDCASCGFVDLCRRAKGHTGDHSKRRDDAKAST